MGNGKAKELICRTHRHELREGNDGGKGVQGIRDYLEEKMGQLY